MRSAACMGDLTRSGHDLVDEIPQLDEGVLALAGDGGPRRRRRCCLLTARVGQLVDALARLGGGLANQLLVLELLERRVHGSRAGLPDTARALGDLLNDLVAVHRLLA